MNKINMDLTLHGEGTKIDKGKETRGEGRKRRTQIRKYHIVVGTTQKITGNMIANDSVYQKHFLYRYLRFQCQEAT